MRGLLGCRFNGWWLFTEFGQLLLDFVIPRYLLIEEVFQPSREGGRLVFPCP
jgi:hypothetical protein